MVNNSEILRILREATLLEAKPIGLAQTDKIKGQSKGENDAYYKDVKKKMSDYEKASTSSMEGAIEEPKFNYENNDEVEYHEDMEILNGEMWTYERKPSEKFTQRAKEAIEGSSNMGNNQNGLMYFPLKKVLLVQISVKNLLTEWNVPKRNAMRQPHHLPNSVKILS